MLPLVLSIEAAETLVVEPDNVPPVLFIAPVDVASSAPPAVTLPA
jgi:hypothetical protein